MTTVEVEFLGGPACGRRRTVNALDGPPPDTATECAFAFASNGTLPAASYVRHPTEREDVAWLYVHEHLDLEKL